MSERLCDGGKGNGGELGGGYRGVPYCQGEEGSEMEWVGRSVRASFWARRSSLESGMAMV